MIVDGTTHQAAAVSTQQKTVKDVSTPRPSKDETAQEARLAASSTPQAALHDSFEHVVKVAGAAAYADDVAGRDRDGVVGGAFEAARKLLDDPYTAEIVDLETAVNAEGLPLLPETDKNGILTQDVLKAYGTSGVGTDGNTQGTTPSDLLDTLG